MSFSVAAKNELARRRLEDKNLQIAELSALLRATGALRIVGLNKLAFSVTTDNPALARRIFLIIKSLFDISVQIQVNDAAGPKKNNLFYLQVSHEQGANRILEEIGIIETQEDGIHFLEDVPKRIVSKKEEKRAYLRGAFLGSGSITDPKKNYHLEFTVTDVDFGRKLIQLLSSFGIEAKTIQRKNMQVIYLKDSGKIIDVLTHIGAHASVLTFQTIKVQKQLKNDVQRQVNCETANFLKVIDTASRQVEAIKYLKKKRKLNQLPDNLREIAELRLKYKDKNLKELGEKLKPPLGKSGVNHRLKKIEEIANELKEKSEL